MSENRHIAAQFIAALDARDWDEWTALLHPEALVTAAFPVEGDQPASGRRREPETRGAEAAETIAP